MGKTLLLCHSVKIQSDADIPSTSSSCLSQRSQHTAVLGLHRPVRSSTQARTRQPRRAVLRAALYLVLHQGFHPLPRAVCCPCRQHLALPIQLLVRFLLRRHSCWCCCACRLGQYKLLESSWLPRFQPAGLPLLLQTACCCCLWSPRGRTGTQSHSSLLIELMESLPASG